MKIYCVWFPRLRGYMGKRGVITESIYNACCFWARTDAVEWAEVLGGEARLFDDAGVEQESSPKTEEPF